jgi:hypothetical protein
VVWACPGDKANITASTKNVNARGKTANFMIGLHGSFCLMMATIGRSIQTIFA